MDGRNYAGHARVASRHDLVGCKIAFLSENAIFALLQMLCSFSRFPAFFPHVLGVYVTVILLKRYPQQSWMFAAIGLSMEGLSCLTVPFMGSAGQLVIPLSAICFGIALIDT